MKRDPLWLGLCCLVRDQGEIKIGRGKQILARRQWEEEVRAEQLLFLLNECLSQIRLKPSDLDALVVCSGPGSFTSVRMSVAVMNALAFGLHRPCFSVAASLWNRMENELAILFRRSPRPIRPLYTRPAHITTPKKS